MRPAFASTRQAFAFALLLLAILLSPVLVGKSLLPSRSQIYSSIWWKNGGFPYFYQQVYEEKGDIDIAFVGSSHLWNAMDPPYVQDQLSKQLGRPAIVRTLCWGEAGSDSLYLIVRDLLQNRKVKLLVVDDTISESNQPHPLAPKWFRWGDDAQALSGLPFQQKAVYYFCSILGMPRDLLELIRSNRPMDLSEKTYFETDFNALSPIDELGALSLKVGFRSDTQSSFSSFKEYRPEINAQASVYTPATAEDFHFSQSAPPPLQIHFLRKFADLLHEKDSKLVLLHVPIYEERKSPFIQEQIFWPTILSSDLAMVGIPPARLFENLTDDDILKFYADPVHMNKNGHDYFTRIMTPTLLHIYDARVTH